MSNLALSVATRASIDISLVCNSNITQHFVVRTIYIIQNTRNYCVGRGKLVYLHALFGNWYGQAYFSFFSNCEEIKLSKAPHEK